jgi:hypothetical protein
VLFGAWVGSSYPTIAEGTYDYPYHAIEGAVLVSTLANTVDFYWE